MSAKTMQLDDAMQAWLHTQSLRLTDVQEALHLETEQHPEGEMQTSAEQLQFMAFLARSIGARNAIEIGVFTGASAIAIAQALPGDGVLHACDIDATTLAIAESWFARAGVQARIQSHLGPGADSMRTLLDDGHAGTIDFIYIDADKTNSDTYFELGLELLRQGGLIAIDNMFRGGRVADENAQDDSTVATRTLAAKLHADERIDYSLLPIGDGLALGRKR